VFSVILFGSILYALSGKPKGAGLSEPLEAPTPAG